MTIIENHITVELMNTFELLAQRVVVRLVIESTAFADFICRGCLPVAINFVTIEGCGRAQAGCVLTRVE